MMAHGLRAAAKVNKRRELWSRRANGRLNGCPTNRISKTMTHRLERRFAAREVAKRLSEEGR